MPAADSPTHQSPGYIPESDPEEEPEEDDEEDPEEDCHTPKLGLDGIRVRGRDVITIRSQS
ncbi:hypothetical protein Tco_0677283, partial [Tanacetum coccineum]